jgi:hypothetical protein
MRRRSQAANGRLEDLVLEQVRAPLRFRQFRVVLAGEGLSMTGDGAFGVALAWLVLQEALHG